MVIRRLTPWWVVALSPLALIPVGLLAPEAHADPVDNYTATVAPAVCATLRDFPTFNGIKGVAQGIVEDTGWSYHDAGTVIGQSVAIYCPDMFPLLNRFIRTYNPPVSAGTVKA